MATENIAISYPSPHVKSLRLSALKQIDRSLIYRRSNGWKGNPVTRIKGNTVGFFPWRINDDVSVAKGKWF
jgi:hypothetical protein